MRIVKLEVLVCFCSWSGGEWQGQWSPERKSSVAPAWALMQKRDRIETQCECAVRIFCPVFVALQVVSTYVALSQFSQNVGDREKWLHCERMAVQKSSLCWFSREGLLATARLMQALAFTKLCLGHLDLSIKLGNRAWVGGRKALEAKFTTRPHTMLFHLPRFSSS